MHYFCYGIQFMPRRVIHMYIMNLALVDMFFYIFALSVLYNGEFEHDFHSHDCDRKRVHPIKLLFSQTFILLDGYYNVSMVQKKVILTDGTYM